MPVTAMSEMKAIKSIPGTVRSNSPRSPSDVRRGRPDLSRAEAVRRACAAMAPSYRAASSGRADGDASSNEAGSSANTPYVHEKLRDLPQVRLLRDYFKQEQQTQQGEAVHGRLIASSEFRVGRVLGVLFCEAVQGGAGLACRQRWSI